MKSTILTARSAHLALVCLAAACGGPRPMEQAVEPDEHLAAPLPDGPIVVRVTGGDYSWHYVYPGADGEFETADDRATTGDLHLPARHRALLQLTSTDFLYMLELPHVNLKEIAVPDLTFEMEFDAGSPGSHELLGDQFCGYAHPDLMGTLVVEEPDEFVRWLAATEVHGSGGDASVPRGGDLEQE